MGALRGKELVVSPAVPWPIIRPLAGSTKFMAHPPHEAMIPSRGQEPPPGGLPSPARQAAVRGLFAHDSLRRTDHEPAGKSHRDQPHPLRPSPVPGLGQRRTGRGCQDHDLDSFPSLDVTVSGEPPFAGAKPRSMKASPESRPPRSPGSSAETLGSALKRPDFDQFRGSRGGRPHRPVRSWGVGINRSLPGLGAASEPISPLLSIQNRKLRIF